MLFLKYIKWGHKLRIISYIKPGNLPQKSNFLPRYSLHLPCSCWVTRTPKDGPGLGFLKQMSAIIIHSFASQNSQLPNKEKCSWIRGYNPKRFPELLEESCAALASELFWELSTHLKWNTIILASWNLCVAVGYVFQVEMLFSLFQVSFLHGKLQSL